MTTTLSPPDADEASDVSHLLDALGFRTRDPARCSRIYAQLRQIAHAHRSRWGGDSTVCTTALVHEAYLKLANSQLRFETRAHFLATASRAMRQVLVTYAEARTAQKRGGGSEPLPLDENLALTETEAADIVAIGDALERLARWDERGARVVECRFFAGLTVDETAEALDLSPATVSRSWHKVRPWLHNELHAAA